MVDDAGADVGKILMGSAGAGICRDNLASALESGRCRTRSRPLLLAVDLFTVYLHILFEKGEGTSTFTRWDQINALIDGTFSVSSVIIPG